MNNIFISNLNINLNLNINISIPPSPKSTRNNGSRLDTSLEEIKEPLKEGSRNEDLSVIDDEMPIKDKINKNIKK